MAGPARVPNGGKAAAPTATPQAWARWVRTAEPPAASTAAITSSGIAAWVKPVPKWMAAAIAKVAASAAIAIPILLLGVRRRVDSCACEVEVMVSPGGSARWFAPDARDRQVGVSPGRRRLYPSPGR